MPVYTIADVRPMPSPATPRALAAARGGDGSPPFGITGVMTTKTQKTAPATTAENQTIEQPEETTKKPLSLLIDWLRVTFKPVLHGNADGTPSEYGDNVALALKVFGGEHGLKWTEGFGRFRYAASFRRDFVEVHYGGPNTNGCCTVEISGQGCRQLEAEGVIDQGEGMEEVGFHTGWRGFFERLVELGVEFKRIDWAFDDASGLLDLSVIEKHAMSGRLSTFMEKAKAHFEIPLDGTGKLFQGVKFGSSKSMREVTFYDKRLERIQAGDADPGQLIRCEIRTREDIAHALGEIFAKHGVVAIAQDLAANLDFKDIDSQGVIKNRYRWARAGWWADFLDHAEKCRVSMAPKLRTLEEKAVFFVQQWGATLASFFHMPDMGQKFIDAVIVQGKTKWSNKHINLMAQHLRALGEQHADELLTAMTLDQDDFAATDFCTSCGVAMESESGSRFGFAPVPGGFCRGCWVQHSPQ